MPNDPYGGQPGEAGGRGIGKTGGAGGAGAKGDMGERGARGRPGKSSWGEWVRWGLTMIALGIALLNMQNIGQNANEGRRQIVETGRIAIGSGCKFDNQRQRELKAGLELFLDDHHALHRMAERFDVSINHENLQRIQAGIDAISVRDCDKVAEILQVD